MSDLRKKLIKLAHENPKLRKHLVPILKQGAGEGTWGIHWVVAASGFLDGIGKKVARYLSPVYVAIDDQSYGRASMVIKFKQVKPAPQNPFYPGDDPIPEWGEITLRMDMFDGLEITGEYSLAGKKILKHNLLGYQALSRANEYSIVSDILELMDLGRIM
jgi:hypothetical protein